MMSKNHKSRLIYIETDVCSELKRKTKRWGSLVRYYKPENSTTKKQIFLIDYEKKLICVKNFTKKSTSYSQHYKRPTEGGRNPREGISLVINNYDS